MVEATQGLPLSMRKKDIFFVVAFSFFAFSSFFSDSCPAARKASTNPASMKSAYASESGGQLKSPVTTIGIPFSACGPRCPTISRAPATRASSLT